MNPKDAFSSALTLFSGIYQDMGVVYLLTNLDTGKVYVGQTWRFRERMKEHASRKRVKQAIQKAIRKHPFSLQVLAVSGSQFELDNLEKAWIILLQSGDKKHGYNITSGGRNFRHTLETRRKIAAAGRGRPGTVKSGPANPFFGRHHTEEAKQKYRATRAGKPGNRKGAKFTPEQLQRLKDAHKGQVGIWTGKKLSESHRASLRAAWVRRKAGRGHVRECQGQLQ
jgi:group I intron endonuclease